MATTKKRNRRHRHNPVESFGVMPTFAKFQEEFSEEVPGGRYPMELKGSDLRAAEGTRFHERGRQVHDVDSLYIGVVELLEKWEADGDDEAGSLAAGILGTLGFEWV